MLDVRFGDADIHRMNWLSISALLKALLLALWKVSICLGGFTLRAGRKILDVTFGLCRQFPLAASGALLGVIAGALIGSIPFLGRALGPVLTPFLAALGVITDAVLDFRDKMLKQAIDERIAKL